MCESSNTGASAVGRGLRGDLSLTSAEYATRLPSGDRLGRPASKPAKRQPSDLSGTTVPSEMDTRASVHFEQGLERPDSEVPAAILDIFK